MTASASPRALQQPSDALDLLGGTLVAEFVSTTSCRWTWARMYIEYRDASDEFSGTAMYGRFRRFRVATSEQVQ